MRWLSFGFESMDYTYFLSRWYEEVEALGGFPAVGTVVGNYTPAYMLLMAAMTYLPLPPLYAIKLVSVAADYLLAVYVGWRVWGVWGMLSFPVILVTLQQLNDKGVIKLWKRL